MHGFCATWVAAGALVLLGADPAARAETDESASKKPTACLDMVAPAGCPSAPETESAVEGVLGRRPFSPASCSIHVTAVLKPVSRGGWQADLHFAKPDGASLGDRTLQSRERRCAALKDPISLVIALMVEAAEPETTLEMPPSPPASQPAASDRIAFASLAVSQGLLPNADLGATLGFGFDLASWLPVRADATLWFPTSAAPDGRGGEFWGWHAGLALCPALIDTASLRGSLCAGGQAGAIRGTGLGLDYSESAIKPYGDVQARAVVSFPVWGSLALSIHVGLAVPWLRPRFVYHVDATDSSVEVYRPHAVAFLGGLGVTLPIVSQRLGTDSSP
jgi:hypothetical protein